MIADLIPFCLANAQSARKMRVFWCRQQLQQSDMHDNYGTFCRILPFQNGLLKTPGGVLASVDDSSFDTKVFRVCVRFFQINVSNICLVQYICMCTSLSMSVVAAVLTRSVVYTLRCRSLAYS